MGKSKPAAWQARSLVAVIRLLTATVRKVVVDEEAILTQNAASPVVYSLWHNRLLMIPAFFEKINPERKVVALTSASRDGGMLSQVLAAYQIPVVRGSSSRRGARALREATRALEEGLCLCITPDGPRGPRYRLQPGVIKLAQVSQVPIVPIHFTYTGVWRLRSWDQFIVPKPFSQVRLHLGEPIAIPAELSEEAFEAQRKEVLDRILSETHEPEDRP
ncbi:MAG: lysophospholipid acyltransferase family protein [Verrucomicrobiota bacterium]